MGWFILFFFGGIIFLNEWLYTGPNRRRLHQIRRENPHYTMREALDQVTREVRGQVVPDNRTTQQVRFRSGFFNDNIVVGEDAPDQDRRWSQRSSGMPEHARPMHRDPGKKDVYSFRDFWDYDVESPPSAAKKHRKRQDRNKNMTDEYEKDGLPY